jgi:hypothetical protein
MRIMMGHGWGNIPFLQAMDWRGRRWKLHLEDVYLRLRRII